MNIADTINALPEPVRKYIAALETECDPAGTIRENYRLREENEGLRIECLRLAALPPLRARGSEIARLYEILKELAEPLNYRQFTKWNPQALASEALTILSRTEPTT